MAISLSEAQGVFTKKLIDVYRERPKPTNFLRSFFPAELSPTLEVSIQVQRGTEKVAVDVYRGDSGNRNTWTRSSEKLFIPPYFREKFDLTKLQLYDRVYAAQGVDAPIFAALINDTVDHQLVLQEKIERAIEIQCKNVLETGIILNAGTGTSIDYRRKATSKIDVLAPNYWAVNNPSNTPFDQFEAAGIFLRTIGKAQGGTFNVILGTQAKDDLYRNTTFLARQNLFNLKLDNVRPPQFNAVGSAYHGQVSAGAYLFNIWTYPEYYQDSNDQMQPYINPKLMIVIPENPRFKTAFGAVPQIVQPGQMPVMGEFVFTNNVDADRRAWYYNVESCPLAIPTAVDTIYTAQVCA